MTKISATIITNNDVDTIGRCIESVAPVADEIVVVDAFQPMAQSMCADGTAAR